MSKDQDVQQPTEKVWLHGVIFITNCVSNSAPPPHYIVVEMRWASSEGSEETLVASKAHQR